MYDPVFLLRILNVSQSTELNINLRCNSCTIYHYFSHPDSANLVESPLRVRFAFPVGAWRLFSADSTFIPMKDH